MDFCGADGYGEVDQVYVLVTGADVLELYPRRPVELHGVLDVFALFTGESYLQTGLFEDLADCGIVRKLVSLYVSAWWESRAELAVQMQEDFLLPHHEHGDCEMPA